MAKLAEVADVAHAVRIFRSALARFALPVALLIATPGSAVAAPPVDDAGAGTFKVQVENGRLSVEVGKVSLATVLQRIGEEARIEVRITGDLGAAHPQRFTDLALPEAIERLVGDEHGLLMLFQPAQTGGGTRALRALRVYANDGGSASALDWDDEANAEGTLTDKAARMRKLTELSKRRDSEAVQQIAGHLASDPDPELRRVSAGALAAIGGEQAAAALESALEDSDPAVRRQAIRSLRMMAGDDAVPVLSRVARADEDPEVRRTAVLLLGKLDSLEAESTLQAARADPDPAVRSAAARIELDR